jgi:hypothetical protein
LPRRSPGGKHGHCGGEAACLGDGLPESAPGNSFLFFCHGFLLDGSKIFNSRKRITFFARSHRSHAPARLAPRHFSAS